MDVCQYIYVLDFGVHVFEGTPAAVAASDMVRAAYLGSESVAPPSDTAVPGADAAPSGSAAAVARDGQGAGT
jgi:hypothetical protein